VQRNAQGVEALNPQKLYAYFASGIPVVSAVWDEMRTLETPARLCSSGPEFVRALRAALDNPGDREAYRRFAAGCRWRERLDALLAALDALDGEAATCSADSPEPGVTRRGVVVGEARET
jgi:hypothetical protein